MNSHSITDYPARRRIRGFEGGAVYEAEKGGVFVVIEDQGTLLDFLNDEDRVGFEPVTVYEFATAADRSMFLIERGWMPRTGSEYRSDSTS